MYLAYFFDVMKEHNIFSVMEHNIGSVMSYFWHNYFSVCVGVHNLI